VALVSPSGPLKGQEELELALANARSMGWDPAPGAHAVAREGYFAGSDAARAEDLNWALSDPKIDGVWFLRGGYGAVRILESINYAALRSRPLPITGYSDITAIHAAVAVNCQIVSYHGPTARTRLSNFTRASLAAAVSRGSESCGRADGARVLNPGVAEGRVLGGNLALLASLVGTTYAQSFRNAILVLEDINESVYRVDRMLQQLLQSGALNGLRALVFGHCTECSEAFGPAAEENSSAAAHGEGSQRRGRTLDEVLLELAQRLTVPCVAGVPLGHIEDQWTVPLGALGRLDADTSEQHVYLSTAE
jgi:muramoyltetrapeptide carboxypeptidase